MIPIPAEAPTLVANAYRWMHRGDHPMAEKQIRKLSAEELRAAHTDLLRLAVLIETVRFEDLAKAIMTPDCPSLPDGVTGFGVHGRVCVWCGALDCDQREVHAQLERVGHREA